MRAVYRVDGEVAECLDVPHGCGDGESVPAVRADRDGALRQRRQQVRRVLLQTEVGQPSSVGCQRLSVQFSSVQDELPTAVCSVQFRMNCQRLSVCGQCYLCQHGHLQDRNNNNDDDDDRFYTTLEQTHCAFVTCGSK